jgi:hypothetical protein
MRLRPRESMFWFDGGWPDRLLTICITNCDVQLRQERDIYRAANQLSASSFSCGMFRQRTNQRAMHGAPTELLNTLWRVKL